MRFVILYVFIIYVSKSNLRLPITHTHTHNIGTITRGGGHCERNVHVMYRERNTEFCLPVAFCTAGVGIDLLYLVIIM